MNCNVDNCEGVAISFEGIPEVVNFSVDTCEEAAISFEGTFGVEYFSDDIFGRLVYNSEGISGVKFFTVGNEQKTAIFEDSGVGSVKDAYQLELLTGKHPQQGLSNQPVEN